MGRGYTRIETWLTAAGAVVLAVAIMGGRASAQPDVGAADRLAQAPVGGKVQADNACYVRLPDLPRGLYGGFGGYNADTGVLTYAGGAEKRTADNTIAYYQLYAIRLDGSMAAWNTVSYSANAGYLRETDRGCREMTSVQLPSGNWASVGGKDGCDGTADRFGDIKELQIGAKADASSVRWVANSGVDKDGLPPQLAEGKFRLARLFAVYDTQRNRLVFGQGTFDDEKDQETRDETYQATRRGSRWSVTQLRPTGTSPSPRYGACAAYVFDKDKKVDGVIVVGGQQGGAVGTTTYREVWWLDFAKSAAGEWSEITSRFSNMDAFGYRREQSCAYDPASSTLYSWVGRGDSKIPDGASRSSGLWRVSLAQLGEAGASLTWERMSKDKLAEPLGRHLAPSVYDFKNGRVFAIGGRNDIDEWSDVWAIYPGVTGDACANLDPYAPYRGTIPTATAPAPTSTPGSGPTPTQPGPTVTPVPLPASVCDYLNSQVPNPVLAAAVANPSTVAGYGQLCQPNKPAGPYNVERKQLGLENPNLAFHPLFNSVVWKCGCP